MLGASSGATVPASTPTGVATAPGAPGATAPAPGTAAATANRATLPFTGSDTPEALLTGSLLVATGLGLTAAARRRRTDHRA